MRHSTCKQKWKAVEVNGYVTPTPYISTANTRVTMDQNVTSRPLWMSIHYGGWSVEDASNIVFSNGVLDPWSGRETSFVTGIVALSHFSLIPVFHRRGYSKVFVALPPCDLHSTQRTSFGSVLVEPKGSTGVYVQHRGSHTSKSS